MLIIVTQFSKLFLVRFVLDRVPEKSFNRKVRKDEAKVTKIDDWFFPLRAL